MSSIESCYSHCIADRYRGFYKAGRECWRCGGSLLDGSCVQCGALPERPLLGSAKKRRNVMRSHGAIL